MTDEYHVNKFDPSGVGLKNGRFIGLPFDEDDSEVVCVSVPWDVTVSYRAGTSTGPENVLEASSQLDLYLQDLPDVWKAGIFVRPASAYWIEQNAKLRPEAEQYILFLESGGDIRSDPAMQQWLEKANFLHATLNDWVYQESKQLLDSGKMVGILGGEHSVPLGFLKALSEQYDSFGILQIDAHMDLRKAYEGFKYSHASICYNALQLPQITQLVQVGIRDMCDEEVEMAHEQQDRIRVFGDDILKESTYKGQNWHEQCVEIISGLPRNVYVSFDIDGLRPDLCPNTGTPVPGGLGFSEAIYLIKTLVESGRRIIGFDLCEVGGAGHEWDGNVGARVLYRLAAWMITST